MTLEAESLTRSADPSDLRCVVGFGAITSTDGMIADFHLFDLSVIGHVVTCILNEVKGVNRVVYDVTSKPAGTTAWE